jgi:hypothetical protein
MVERARPDLASAMYPSLSREARVRAAVLERHAAENQQRKARLLADLRAISRRMDERLQREGRR